MFKSNVFKCGCGNIFRCSVDKIVCKKCKSTENIVLATPEEKRNFNRELRQKYSKKEKKIEKIKEEPKIEENKEFEKPAEEVELKEIDIDKIIEANKVYKPEPEEPKIEEPKKKMFSGFKFPILPTITFCALVAVFILYKKYKNRNKNIKTVETVPENEETEKTENYYATPQGFF
jgi:hypothetical protein